MNTNLDDKSTNSLMSLLDSGAGRIKIVAILSFVTQGLNAVQMVITRAPANVVSVLLAIYMASLLWKQAGLLKQFQQTNRGIDLEDALKQEAQYWQIMGILLILCLGLVAIGVLVMIAVGGR